MVEHRINSKVEHIAHIEFEECRRLIIRVINRPFIELRVVEHINIVLRVRVLENIEQATDEIKRKLNGHIRVVNRPLVELKVIQFVKVRHIEVIRHIGIELEVVLFEPRHMIIKVKVIRHIGIELKAVIVVHIDIGLEVGLVGHIDIALEALVIKHIIIQHLPRVRRIDIRRQAIDIRRRTTSRLIEATHINIKQSLKAGHNKLIKELITHECKKF